MSEKSEQTPEAPATDSFKLIITLTRDEVQTPVEFEVTYPKGRGIAAIEALHQISDYAPSVGVSLAENGDPSVLAAMGEAGVGLDDTEVKQP